MKVLRKKKLEIKSDYDKVNWEEVITVLMAFSLSLLGEKQFSNTKKKLAYDFTMDTILRYLENQDKFDPTRNPDLLNYLKYNILRQIIFNFKKSSMVKTRVNIEYAGPDKSDNYSLDELYYENGKNIETKVDLNIVLSLIEKKLHKDEDLEVIFNLFYLKDLKRNDHFEQLSISLKEFDNRSRRLKRLLDKEIKSVLKLSDER